MRREHVTMSEQDWSEFYEREGSGYFKLESETQREYGDDLKTLLYKFFDSTATLAQTSGVVAGFGFAAIGHVKQLQLFLLGEFFLLLTVLIGLFWIHIKYKTNLNGIESEMTKVKQIFAERFATFKQISDKALSDINKGVHITIPISHMVNLQNANSVLLRKFVIEPEFGRKNNDPSVWVMFTFTIGSLLLILSFTQITDFSRFNSDNQYLHESKKFTLSADSYSSEVISLPPIKTQDEIFGISDSYTYENRRQELCVDDILQICPDEGEDDPAISSYKHQIEKNGDLASRFLPSESITWVKYFDIDGDKENETIIALCELWGNHCPHRIIIVKGDKQIFETSSGLSINDIVGTEEGNGFFVLWDSEEMRSEGVFQPLGYVKTRFIHKNGNFTPVSENEIWY